MLYCVANQVLIAIDRSIDMLWVCHRSVLSIKGFVQEYHYTILPPTSCQEGLIETLHW